MALEDSDSYTETSFGRNSWIENAVGNLLGLDAESGDPAWKVQMDTAIQESQKSRDFSREMADLQYYRSSPANQLRLYREAGLNPSLMYGQMSDLQTSIPASAEASPSGAPNGNLASLLGLGPDFARVAGELSLIPEQKAKLDAERMEILSRIPVNNAQVLQLRELANKTSKEAELIGLNIRQFNDTYDSVTQELISRAEAGNEKNRFTVDELNVKREFLIKNAQAEYEYLRNQANEALQKAYEAAAKAREASANADVAEKRKEILDKQKELLDKNMELLEQAIEKAKKENKFITADKIIGYTTDILNAAANVVKSVGSITNIAGGNFSTTTTKNEYSVPSTSSSLNFGNFE